MPVAWQCVDSPVRAVRLLSSRTAFFSELGLNSSVNEGVFDGKDWKASGEVIDIADPTTGETLAKVRMGSQVGASCLAAPHVTRRTG